MADVDAPDTISPRRRERLDRGWLFHLGDIDQPLANKHLAAYMNNKAGWARGAARGGYDDSDWRELDLPHDWAVEGEFSPTNHLNAGYLPRGVAWYRRHIRLDEADRGRRVSLHFDGVATHCTVYVNGHLLHRHWCGYTPFDIDFTDVATFGEQLNVVSVRVDATYMEGWWYEGAGIYRHVYLDVSGQAYIEPSPQVIPRRDDNGRWSAWCSCWLRNHTDQNLATRLRVRIRDTNGTVVAERVRGAQVQARSADLASQSIDVSAPRLWSLDHPNLYTAEFELFDHRGNLLDRTLVRHGFRTLRFDADRGFFLNDEPVLLKGTCVHQDHAGVGVAVPDSIQRFRVRRLKDMGCNAIRPGHHPLAPEFMDACDELGVLVLAENRNFGSSPQHLAQLRTLVLRDRNRPSVFAWCLCNEEPIQTTPIAKQIAKTMADEVRMLDPSRPVTAAVSGGLLNDDSMADVLDVMGINYQLAQHDAFHAKHPTLPVFMSETHCVYGTRNTKKTDPAKHHFADDDTAHAPWGATARATREHLQARPWLAGLFAWTGFDYRGEPSPHEWPSVTSHWGIMDLCGFEKGAFWLHRQWWTGQPAPAVEEAGPAVALGLEVHPSFDAAVVADGRCTVPVTVFAADAQGRRVTDANDHVEFALDGPASIVGVGNGDPTSHEPDKAMGRCLFRGLAQVLVQVNDVAGTVTLKATSNSLATATLAIPVASANANELPYAPVARRRYLLTEWRMSPITAARPDPAVAPDAADMNTWVPVQPGPNATRPFESSSGFAVYRATAKLPKKLQLAGARLAFHAIGGDAEVYVDGKPAPWLPGAQKAVAIAPSAEPRSVAVLVRGSGAGTGLCGDVELLPSG